MRQTNVDVGTCPAAGVGFDAGVNIASDAAEGDVLMSRGARKQKHPRRRTRRRLRHHRRPRCRCSSPPAEHINDAGLAEPELAVADADSSGPDTHSWSGRVMWKAPQTPTSR